MTKTEKKKQFIKSRIPIISIKTESVICGSVYMVADLQGE